MISVSKSKHRFILVQLKKSYIWVMTLLLLFFPPVVFSQPQGHFYPSSLSPIQRGDFLLMQSLNEEALLLYQSLIAKGKEGGYAFRGLVRTYKSMNKLDEAESWVENYLTENPNSSPASYALGYLFYVKNDMRKAEKLFKRALELDVNNALALNNLGAVLLGQNLYTEAANLVQKAIKINPKERMFFSNLRKTYKMMGNPDQIIADYNFYLKGEDNSDLIRGYGMAVGRRMRQASFKLYSEGHLDEATSKWKEIEKIYKKIDHKPGLVPVYFSLGLLHEEKGDLKNAQEYFKQVLMLNPLHIHAKERLGNLR